MAGTRGGRLLYLYGPPASGKLTIAQALQARTGLRLFHNHLTVDALTPVFEFRSQAFADVLHRLRLDVFATAARAGIDLIFTNNSAWGPPDGRDRFFEFTELVRETVADNGGAVTFVQIRATDEQCRTRIANESRRAHDKLLDPAGLDVLLASHDASPLHDDDLVVDTGELQPDEAAAVIAAAL